MKNTFGHKDYLIIDSFTSPADAISQLSKTDFSKLHLIHFQGNQQNLVKSGFKIHAPKLRKIIFAGKRTLDAVGHFEGLFDQMPQLVSLKFVNIPLKSIPPFVFNLQHIKELSFRTADFPDIPAKLFALKNMEHLSFTFAPNILTIPDDIRQLQQLKKFGLHGASPGYISPALFQLPKLRHISLIDTVLPQTKGLSEALEQYTHRKGNNLVR